MKANEKWTTDYSYDKNNRLVACAAQGEPAAYYSYDAAGNMVARRICADQPDRGSNTSSEQTAPTATFASGGTGWQCTCGRVNKGKFCSQCGTPKPQEALAPSRDESWQCACGRVNKSAFCSKCGTKRP